MVNIQDIINTLFVFCITICIVLLKKNSDKIHFLKHNKEHFGSIPEREPPIRINYHTRGEKDFELMGVLYNINDNRFFNLYGRNLYSNSNNYEYYIQGKDIGGLEYKLYLDQTNEIYDKSTIKIPLNSNKYTVSLYDYKKLRYIPFPP